MNGTSITLVMAARRDVSRFHDACITPCIYRRWSPLSAFNNRPCRSASSAFHHVQQPAWPQDVCENHSAETIVYGWRQR
jgi:hypothetical protein